MSTAALLVTATALSAGASIIGGIESKKAGDKQAALFNEQAKTAQREAELEAQRKEQERTRFIAKQKVAFLANGIGLSGSPLAVFQNTFNEFQKEIDAIRRSGSSQSRFLRAKGSIAESSGRASLTSGFLNAGTTVAGNAFLGKENNIF